jgi:hypothetical protein
MILLEDNDYVLKLYIENECPYTQAAFVDIFNHLIKLALQNHKSTESRLNPADSLQRAIKLDWIVDEPGIFPILTKSIFIHKVLSLGLNLAKGKLPANENTHAWIQDLLIQLSETDPNACALVIADLEQLTAVLHPGIVFRLTTTVQQISQQSCDGELVVIAEDYLTMMFARGYLVSNAFATDSIQRAFRGPGITTPSRIESSIQLWGYITEKTFSSHGLVTAEAQIRTIELLYNIGPLLDDLMVSYSLISLESYANVKIAILNSAQCCSCAHALALSSVSVFSWLCREKNENNLPPAPVRLLER